MEEGTFSEKVFTIGICLIFAGIMSFPMRASYLSCDAGKDICSIYQVPGTSQYIKYSDIQDCSCATYDELHTPTSESEKERRSRKRYYRSLWRLVGNEKHIYKAKTKTVQREYLDLYFDENIVNKYKNIDLKQVQGFTCEDIDNVCRNISAKRTFTFKSNKYLHSMFDYWWLCIVLGILALVMSKKIK